MKNSTFILLLECCIVPGCARIEVLALLEVYGDMELSVEVIRT